MPKATDVLSFPSHEHKRGRESKNGHGNANELGDIAISPETARRNAKKYGRTVEQEIRILMLHGTLHLLGYDHEADDGAMERLEMRLRRRLRLA
jgi:probable rRNA maturation factor